MLFARKNVNLIVAAAIMLTAGLSSCLLTACVNNSKPTGVPLPDKFPISCYPGSECTKADSTPIGQNKYRLVAVVKAEGEFDKIVEFYKQQCAFNNFQLLSDNNRRGTVTLEAKSSDANLLIVLVPVDVSTVVSISYDPKLENK